MANTEITLKSLWREEQSGGFQGRAPWMISLDGDELLAGQCDIRDSYQVALEHGSPVAFHLVEEAVYESGRGDVFRARFFKRNLNSFAYSRDKSLMRTFRNKRGKWSASYNHGKAAVRVGPHVFPSDVTQYLIGNDFPKRPTILGEPALLHFINSDWNAFAAKMFRKSRGKYGAGADKTDYQRIAQEIARKYETLESFKGSSEAWQLYSNVHIVPAAEISAQWSLKDGSRLFQEHLVHWAISAGASVVLKSCDNVPRRTVCKAPGDFKDDTACLVRGMPDCCMVMDSLAGKKVKYL